MELQEVLAVFLLCPVCQSVSQSFRQLPSPFSCLSQIQDAEDIKNLDVWGKYMLMSRSV